MEKKMKLQIQLFADEQYVQNDDEATPMSLDEILEDSYYQSQFDKKIAKANETAVANAVAKARLEWDKEQADKIAESQKLAQMDEIQKKDYEIESLKKQLAQRDEDKQANDLMNEAIKQASEKGIPLEIMTALNYKNETADSISSKIDIYAKAFQTLKTNTINEYSKEKAPQKGDYEGEKKDKSKMTYEELCNLEEYKK